MIYQADVIEQIETLEKTIVETSQMGTVVSLAMEKLKEYNDFKQIPEIYEVFKGIHKNYQIMTDCNTRLSALMSNNTFPDEFLVQFESSVNVLYHFKIEFGSFLYATNKELREFISETNLVLSILTDAMHFNQDANELKNVMDMTDLNFNMKMDMIEATNQDTQDDDGEEPEHL